MFYVGVVIPSKIHEVKYFLKNFKIEDFRKGR